MTIRTRRETATFRHPFRIHGIDRMLPAGSYDRMLPAGSYPVIADEETIESETYSAWRRVGTSIIVPAESPAGTTEMLSIRALDLADAMASDASAAHD